MKAAALVRDMGVYGASDFAFRLIAFAVFPLYARVFSVSEFGIIALLASASALLGMVANCGLNNAVQRFYWDPQTPKHEQRELVSTGALLLLASVIACVGVLLCALYPFRDALFSRYGIEWNILVLALLTVIPDQLLQFGLDTTRLHFSPFRFALVSFLKNVLGVAVALYSILVLGSGIAGYFVGMLVGGLLALPVAFILIRRDIVFGFDRIAAEQLLRFGTPFIFAGIGYWAFNSIDRWMIAEMSSASEVGLFSMAGKVSAVLVFLSTAFGQAWSPLANKARRDGVNYRALYGRVLTLWFFALTMVGSTLGMFAPELLRALVPQAYWEAAPVVAALAQAAALLGTTQVTAIGVSIERKSLLFVRAAWLSVAIGVGLNLLLIPSMGALGAGMATLAANAFLTCIYLYWSQQLHPMQLEWRKLAYTAFLAVVFVPMAVVITRIEPSITLAAVKGLLIAGALMGGLLMQLIPLPVVHRAWGRKGSTGIH